MARPERRGRPHGRSRRARPGGPASADPSVNLIDGTHPGSITVHTYEQTNTATGLPHNGTEVTNLPSGLVPVQGVQYTATKVPGYDLTTNTDWARLVALSDAYEAAHPANRGAAWSFLQTHESLTEAQLAAATLGPATTNASGAATFPNLGVGLYLVAETSRPHDVTGAAPFLVTVPLTDPDGLNAWLYDVHVYPKNETTPPPVTKTVDDATSVQLGDPVTWTVDATIPDRASFSAFQVVDNLDAKLDYVSTQVSLVDAAGLAVPGVTLDPTDYTVSVDGGADVATAGGPVVTVALTDLGRAKIAANRATGDVANALRVVIDTTVNATGVVRNVAVFFPNDSDISWTPGEPGQPVDPDAPEVPTTPEVVSKWGNVTFEKLDETGAGLAGARFSVYTSLADAQSGSHPVTLGAATVFEVDADGILTLTGLRYSDWADGGPVSPGQAGYITYYLVEVKAPAGYELLAEPVPFTVDDDSTDAAGSYGVDHQITNVPSNGGWDLPLTGGTGAALLYTAGALLAVGALLLLVRARRRAADAR